MAWTDLDTNGLLPGEPWTSAKALAVYENPIAAFDVDAGAPRLARLVRVGSNSSSGSVAISADVPAGYEGALLRFNAASVSVSGSLIVDLSDDNGSTYSAAFSATINTSGGVADVENSLFVDFVTGAVSYASFSSVEAFSGSGSATVPTGTVDRFRVRVTSGNRSSLFAELTGKTANS